MLEIDGILSLSEIESLPTSCPDIAMARNHPAIVSSWRQERHPSLARLDNELCTDKAGAGISRTGLRFLIILHYQWAETLVFMLLFPGFFFGYQ